MNIQKKPISISISQLQQIKQKTNKFIQEYELHMIQKQFQKQKIKQNVMLQIMTNRQKKQSSNQSTSKQTSSQGHKTARDNQLMSFPIQKVVDSRMVDGHYPSDRITRNNQIDTKEGIQTLLKKTHTLPNDEKQLRRSIISDRKCDEQGQNNHNDLAEITFSQKNKAKNLQISKNINNNLSIKQNQEKEQIPTFRNQKKKIVLDQDKVYHGHNNNQTNVKHQNKYKYQYQSLQKLQQNERFESLQEKSPQNYEQQQNEGQDQQYYENQNNQYSQKSPFNQTQELPQERDFQKTYEKGVFLTMQENQSQFTQAHKNCAFDILMDKSDQNQNIQQLKKKKLQELQKKRAIRMEQFRKNQEAKKAQKSQFPPQQKTKYSQIHNRKSQKTLNDDDDNQTVRSNNQLDKNQSKKVNRTSQKPPRNPSGFNYGQNQIMSKNENVPNPPSVRASRQFDNNDRKAQIQNTPKTVSTTRHKQKRSNIFTESPNGRDKSTSKHSIQPPKIEPKTIKNGFNRQSNKKLMITAITYVCLPGQLNRKQRQKLIDVLENESSNQYFIFLFKQYSRKVIKAIYVLEIDQDRIRKIYGDKAPSQLYSDQIHEFYRFDSGSREFKAIDGCKSFSLAVNAIDLK